jgi:hypothetical protein
MYQSGIDFKCPYSNRPLKPLTPLNRLHAIFVLAVERIAKSPYLFNWSMSSAVDLCPNRASAYTDAKVANRDLGVEGLARGRQIWSLNDGQLPNLNVAGEASGTRYHRVEGNRRASRNGLVSDLPPDIPTVTIRTFLLAVQLRQHTLTFQRFFNMHKGFRWVSTDNSPAPRPPPASAASSSSSSSNLSDDRNMDHSASQYSAADTSFCTTSTSSPSSSSALSSARARPSLCYNAFSETPDFLLDISLPFRMNNFQNQSLVSLNASSRHTHPWSAEMGHLALLSILKLPLRQCAEQLCRRNARLGWG